MKNTKADMRLYCRGLFRNIVLNHLPLRAQIAVPLLTLISVLCYSASALANTPGPKVVFACKVTTSEFYDQIEALGTLEANEQVDLTSKVIGWVESIRFKEGQWVEKDTILINLESTEEQAIIAEEQSRLLEAERQVKRLVPLVKRGAATQSSLDEQRLQVEISEARLVAAKARLQHRTIDAPFSGVTGIRQVSVGSLVQPGEVIATLDDTSQMKLHFSVPERFIAMLSLNMPVQASTSVWPEQTFSGKIAIIDSRVDPVTRSVKVVAILPNSTSKLKSGMLIQALLNSQPREGLAIPEQAIMNRGKDHFILVLEPSGDFYQVLRVAITIVDRKKGYAFITQGIQPDQLIVSEGIQKVSPGDQVKVGVPNFDRNSDGSRGITAC